MHPQCRSNLIKINSQAPSRISAHRIWSDRAGHVLRQWLLAAFLGGVGAVPIMAAPIQLPAIAVPASQEHHAGKVIFIELVTPDLAAAKQFYAGLFGWTYRDI